jgi:hypothetical protein
MTDFLFTSPDGRKFKVKGPDGATLDDAAGMFDQVKRDHPEWLKSPPSSVGDFFRSIPRGFVSGLTSAASALGQSEANLTMPPERAAEVPGPERSTELVEQTMTGPMHRPETTAGRYGASVGETLGNPASWVGPGGTAVKTAANVLAGAGAQAGEELTGSRVGRFIGGVAGGLLPDVGRGLAVSTRGMRNPEAAATADVANAVTRDREGRIARGGTASPFTSRQEAEMAAAGTPRALIDEGRRTQRLGRTASNVSPEAQETLTEFIAPRFEGQSERVAGRIRGMAGNPNAVADLEALQDAAQRANRPAYERAYRAGEDGLWSQGLERLVGARAVRQAMQNAVERWSNRAVGEGYGAFNPGVTFENGVLKFGQGKGAPPYPNTQFWDYTQRELRDMQTAAARAGRNEEAGSIGTLRRQLLEEVDRANPAFAQARRGAAQFFGAENALEAGQGFIKSTASIEEARRAFARMSVPEQELFRRGYASSLIDLVERSGVNRDVTIANAFNSTAGRAHTRLALGQDADRLEALLRAEQLVDRARKAMGNSTTAQQLHDMSGGIGHVPTTLHGVIGKTLTAAFARARMNPRVAEHVAQMLVSNDPAVLNRGLAIIASDPSLMDALRRATISGTTAAMAGPSEDALAQ